MQADPKHAYNLGRYALFLEKVRKDYDRAEEFYRRAVQADPANGYNRGNYAGFLKNVRSIHEGAEELRRGAQ